MTQYDFEKLCDAERLTLEIKASSITIVLDHISILGSTTSCTFKADLSGDEQTTLSALITAHIATPLPTQAQQIEVTKQPDPAPFATPSYRTKLNATPNTITVAPNTSDEIQFKMLSERYVTGGAIIVKNAEFGDYIEASVVDVDGIIPSPYRAALCEAWPIISTYIEKSFVKIDNGSYTHHEINTYPLNAKITAGLYLCVTYHAVSVGNAREVAVNYNLTKKL